MNDTTNAAKRPSGLRACADGLDANPDKDFAQKCMRHAADRMEDLETELTAVTEQRDEALSDLEFRRDLYALQTKQLDDVREQRDRLAENNNRIIELLKDGLQTDGSHHKQWYLNEVLKLINTDIAKDVEMHWTHDKGIAP